MVDSIASTSPYAALQPFGGSVLADTNQRQPAQLDLPPRPGPLEQLREAINSTDIDTEELAARVVAAFGEDGQTVVSDTGDVDLNRLSDLIAQNRAETVSADLVSRFGEDAADFVTEKGDFDRAALDAFLEERGLDEQYQENQTGFSGAPVTGYGPQGQANTAQPLNFLSVFA